MRYQEAAPSPALSAAVHCYWFLSGQSSLDPEIVCPDGRMELIVNLADPMWRVDGAGVLSRQPQSFIVGQMLCPTEIVATEAFDICGVRFRHSGAARILGGLQDFTGRMVPCGDVWGSQARTLQSQLAEAGSLDARAAVFDRFLVERLRTSDESAAWFVESVVDRGGAAPVRELARQSGWSERQFTRRFESCVGLTPKEFSRVIRFQRVLKRMERESPLDAALACGFFDQSHFIREFKALSGSTPAAYWRRTHPMSVFYNTEPPGAAMMIE